MQYNFLHGINDAIYKWVFHTSGIQKLLDLYKLFFLSLAMVYRVDQEGAVQIIAGSNRLGVKIMIGMYLVVNLENIIALVMWYVPSIQWKEDEIPEEKYVPVNEELGSIDGVSIRDLILFMLEEWGLPTAKSKERFGITNDRLKKIGDNLERVKILERGTNNARVLATKDLDKIVDMVAGVEDSNELGKRLVKINDSQYSIAPYSTVQEAVA